MFPQPKREGEMMKKTKVVLFPMPADGHLVSMIELAKRIILHDNGHSLGVTVLLLRPSFPSLFLSSSSAISAQMEALAASGFDIDFVHLPQSDFVPEGEGLIEGLRFIESQRSAVATMLASLLSSATRISAFVVDGFCIPVTGAALDLRIPTYVFYTSGAGALSFVLHTPFLDRKYESDLKDVTDKIHIPGVSPLPVSALPDLFLEKKNPIYCWFLKAAGLYSRLNGVLVNTFQELQPGAIRALTQDFNMQPNSIYPLGPLLGLGSRTKEPDHECIKWLDRQPGSSVVFMCFGSVGSFPADQIAEIARGIELSGQRFLWSVRVRPRGTTNYAEPMDADLDEVLPVGFVERTSERGLVWSKWVPQIQILSHPAVGGFVSHCGWNSTLESIWFGVPIIAWPLYAEQKMNAVELVKDLGLGLGLDEEGEGVSGGLVSAEEINRVVSSLMEGDEGKKVREKMMKMRKAAREAMEEGGSSYTTLASLVQEWAGSN